MPPILAKAHSKLDRAIDLLYSKTPFTSDAERVALLFEISRSNTLVARIDKVSLYAWLLMIQVHNSYRVDIVSWAYHDKLKAM